MKNLTRTPYLIATALLFGLLLLIFFFSPTPFIRSTVGDYVVVIWLYTGALALRPSLPPLPLGAAIFGLSLSVETMQAGVIQRFFDTSNRLVEATLGSTFDPVDILAYFLGVATVVLIDRRVRQ